MSIIQKSFSMDSGSLDALQELEYQRCGGKEKFEELYKKYSKYKLVGHLLGPTGNKDLISFRKDIGKKWEYAGFEGNPEWDYTLIRYLERLYALSWGRNLDDIKKDSAYKTLFRNMLEDLYYDLPTEGNMFSSRTYRLWEVPRLRLDRANHETNKKEDLEMILYGFRGKYTPATLSVYSQKPIVVGRLLLDHFSKKEFKPN